MGSSGKLDFLIVGHLTNGTSANVCIEFKLVHSQDLEYGILKQLPLPDPSDSVDHKLWSNTFTITC
jgi:hypothetical protein